MFFIKQAYASVWAVDKIEEKYAKVRLGTSEKKQDGTYENSNWFATFLGKAKDKVETLEPKDRITIITGKITNVGKKQDDGKWINYLNVVVFDFEKQGEEGASTPSKGLDTPPQVDEDEDDNGLPF